MESLLHAMLSNALAVTVLAGLVAILGRTCRRPALIHGLWLVVMLKLVTPPVVPVSLPVGFEFLPSAWSSALASEASRPSIALTDMNQDLAVPTEAEQCSALLPCDDDQGISGADSSSGEMGLDVESRPAIPAFVPNAGIRLPEGWIWEHLVLALMLSGAVAWWMLAFVRIIRFNRLMIEIDPAPEEWQMHTAALATQLGLGEAPSLYLVPGRVPPMLWAIGSRPRLLVPSELWPATSLDQRTSLLLHELAHLKRRDHWVRWLELIVGGLYWWHPAVWWGRRLLREAEEQCCDAWVVWAMPKGAKTYATALLTALEFVSGARTAPAATSATSGNGHVSCLKRRLKMIVRAQTPKGLSWAGRLAVVGAAAFLLPLAPSWGQKNDVEETSVDVRPATDFSEYNVLSGEAVQTADQSPKLGDEQTERRIREQFVRDPAVVALSDEILKAEEQRDHAKAMAKQPNDPARRAAELRYKKLMAQYTSVWESKSKELRAQVSGANPNVLPSNLTGEERVRLASEAFVRDPAVVALSDEILKAEEQRDHAKAMAKQANDPARRAADLKYKKLLAQYTELWEKKRGDMLARLTQDDAKKDEPSKEDKGRATAERFEEHVKDVIEKLAKELGPVGEELRKILEKSVDDIHETLKKEGLAPEELRKALEKSHNEMRKGLEKGGSVNKELREAVEKSRRDLQKEWDDARNDLRMAVRDRAQPRRSQERAEDAKKDADQAESAKKEAAEIEKERAEIEKVRAEVRTLEQQLRQANRRLIDMQRRTIQRPRPGGRRDMPAARIVPGRAPSDRASEPEASPRPARPATPATPASPRRVEPPAAARQPVAPRRPQVERGRSSGEQPEYDKRLQNLDQKLEELLKEVKKLKEQKQPEESKNSSPRRTRSASPGTPVVF